LRLNHKNYLTYRINFQTLCGQYLVQ